MPEKDLKEGPYGSLCRVGLLLPSLNMVTEPEMSRLAPEGVSFVNEAERKFLQKAGFEVTDIHGLEMGKTPQSRIAIGRLKYDAVCDLARRVDSPEAEGVFLSCLNLATVGILERLEEELGNPVLSSTVATFWAALRRGAVETSISGYGSFLREFPPLPADQASVSR